ncbi:MAG: transposase [Clostridia bacterium]
MGRPWREEYQGGIYHVIARGNNKEYIFKDSIDKSYFIKQLKEAVADTNYRIFGYVLMGNHYHIIIQTIGKKLQEIMHQINNKYSKYFNAKYKRAGHVFQGRYKAIVVQDERYLIGLLRYVHQNPIQANLCKSVVEYKWSSDVLYRKGISGFVNVDIVLKMLNVERADAIKQYKELMAEKEEQEFDNMKVVGDEAYQIMCMSKKETDERKPLDVILKETGIGDEEYQLVKAGSRKRKLTPYKLDYARAALALKYTYKEIGLNINAAESSVKDMVYKYEGRQ